MQGKTFQVTGVTDRFVNKAPKGQVTKEKRQIGLYQTQKLLHIKGNNQYSEEDR